MPVATGEIDVASNDLFVQGVPHDLFARLRHEAPVYRHPRVELDQPEFFWVLTRHADVVRTSRVFETYSSARMGCLLYEDRPDLDIARMLIDLDPPEHTRLRMLVSRGFTPRAVKSLDGHFREVTSAHPRRRPGGRDVRLRHPGGLGAAPHRHRRAPRCAG